MGGLCWLSEGKLEEDHGKALMILCKILWMVRLFCEYSMKSSHNQYKFHVQWLLHVEMIQLVIFLHRVETIVSQGEIAAIDVHTSQGET
jgi:hypothetical protein